MDRLAWILVLHGCGARSRATDPFDAGRFASDAGADASTHGRDAGGDSGDTPRPDAAVDGDRCVDPSEMPPDGAMGDACESDADCPDRLQCTATSFEAMSYAIGSVCFAFCDPSVADDCPDGATCVEDFDGTSGVCVDQCVVSAANPLLESACGCEAGRQCYYGMCIPGCDADSDCCRLSSLRPEDAKGRECTERCLSASSVCAHEGPAGSRIGGPCLIDGECPTHSGCEWYAWTPVVGGMRYPIAGFCTGACDRPPGYPDACAGVDGAVCAPAIDSGSSQCFESCVPGGAPCSRDDFVCYPTPDAAGYCYPSCTPNGGNDFCVFRHAGACLASGLCSG